MNGDYKFLRVAEGRTFFVHVWVRSESATESSIDESAVLSVRRMYGDALVKGVETALAAYGQRGGDTQRVEVVRVLESAVDTTPDVVTCAAAMATWKAFGLDDSEASIVRREGTWSVTFGPAQ